jgi:hypothetical protein
MIVDVDFVFFPDATGKDLDYTRPHITKISQSVVVQAAFKRHSA